MSKPAPHQVDATFYAQIVPEFRFYQPDRDNPDHIQGAKLAATTQGTPSKAKPGAVTVKLTVRMPKAAFVALRPEAVIEIPADLIRAAAVEVLAEDPNDANPLSDGRGM